MLPWIVWLGEQGDPDGNRLGAKAANLARLSRFGLTVPKAFCITADAYRAFVASTPSVRDAAAAGAGISDPGDLGALRRASEAFRAAVTRAELPGSLSAELRSAYADPRLGRFPAPVAVRSSATAEDLPGASFAGQYDTFLGVQDFDLLAERVRDCWASLWSQRALQYRLRHFLPHASAAMAVICQRMVPAEYAGVLFTADPVSNDRDVFVVNVHPGPGEAVVGGTATASQVRLSRRDGTALGGDGSPISPLSQARLAELATMSRAVEGASGGVPQDIEWVYSSDGQLSLLQARPITTLRPQFVEPDPSVHWNRKVLGEWMEEPLSPMFGTLLVPRLVRSAVALFRSQLGIALREPSTKEFHGYLYMRADLDWLASLSLIVRLPRLLARMDARWHGEVLPSYRERMARLSREDPTGMDDPGLLAHLDAAATTAGDFAGWVLVSAVPCLLSETLFAALTHFLTPGEGRFGYTRFLTGVVSQATAGAVALAEIARAVRADETVRQVAFTAAEGSLPQVLKSTPAGAEVCRRVQAYLVDFGHQSLRLDFIHPTLAEAPGVVWSALRVQTSREVADPTAELAARRAARDRAVAERLGRFPKYSLRRVAWLKALRFAQRYVAIRDDRPFYLQLAWPVQRRALLELGRRLVVRRQLGSADDVFYVNYQEVVTTFVGGKAVWTPECIERRKAERAARQRFQPPDRINSGGFTAWLDRLWPQPAREGGNELRGFAGSPGSRRGVARVVWNENDYARLKGPESILVTRVTTPSWTPLFALVSAVVTEVGSPLSHAAIISREYGIPCVIGVPEATRRIADGQEITVDGSRGRVIVHVRPAGEACPHG